MKRGMTMTLALGALVLAGAAPPVPAPGGADLRVEIQGLRNARGVVHLCLSGNAQRFLDCKSDRSALARTVAAGQASALDLGRVRPGSYALLVVHDENGNGKLDMTMGIPREGFGFSNNPAMRPRAPRWEETRFTMPASPMKQDIRIRYVL